MDATTSSNKFARELHRRRIIAGDRSSFKRAVAEVSVFSMYGRELSINDLHLEGSGVTIVSVDDQQRSFVVVAGDKRKWELEQSTDHDVLVFVDTENEDCEVVGWMAATELIEAPTVGGRFVVTDQYLFPMPATLDFSAPCTGVPCDANAIWDNDYDSWDCFRCNKHRHDEGTRVLIAGGSR